MVLNFAISYDNIIFVRTEVGLDRVLVATYEVHLAVHERMRLELLIVYITGVLCHGRLNASGLHDVDQVPRGVVIDFLLSCGDLRPAFQMCVHVDHLQLQITDIPLQLFDHPFKVSDLSSIEMGMAGSVGIPWTRLRLSSSRTVSHSLRHLPLVKLTVCMLLSSFAFFDPKLRHF